MSAGADRIAELARGGWAVYRGRARLGTCRTLRDALRQLTPEARRYYSKAYVRNPIGDDRDLREAADLYRRFTGHNVTWEAEVELPRISAAFAVGPCLAIAYQTTRDGRRENYMHEFRTKQSRPLVAIASDGQSALLLGGEYRFTERGFVDHG